MVSYILITGYSILLFMNPLNFKFLQVPAVLFYTFLTASKNKRKKTKHYCTRQIESDSNSDWQMTNAAINFANVFLNKKRLEDKKR